MIKKEDIFQIGKIIKPHGLRGELSFDFQTDIFDEIETPYFICEIDGIFVPFFIEEYRFKNDTSGLVKFENTNSEEEARELSNSNLYMSRSLIPENISIEDFQNPDFYTGYQIIDQNGELIGTISAIDDSTENTLFCISSILDNEEILIPACEEYISEINDNNKTIKMTIPDGLLELDKE